VSKLSSSQLTSRLFEHLLKTKPVTVYAKLPTLDDVRHIMSQQFENADDVWKITAAKKVVSRLEHKRTSYAIRLI